jgi:hypothetical protein
VRQDATQGVSTNGPSDESPTRSAEKILVGRVGLEPTTGGL